MTVRTWLWVGALAAGSVVGCGSDQKPEPEIASSAAEPRYAMDYAGQLEGTVSGFGDSEAHVQESRGKFADYPSQLEKAPWEEVAKMVEQANETGKSQHYVEGIRKVGGARSFFDEEKEEITKKVGGAAQYTVKQASCDTDVYGPVASSFEKSVKERLLEHQRRNNGAFTLLERHREELGKENVAKLEEQLDEIAFASYVVHIEMVEQKVALTRMLDEVSTVKSTMDQFIEEEQEFQKQTGRPKESLKASEARLQAMKESQAKVERLQKDGTALQEKIEERLKKAQEDWDKAVADLAERYRARGA
jgi:hypothetical protein